jgi:hypothetical protein
MIILSNESQYERYRIFTLLRNAVSMALGRHSASSAVTRIRELEADMRYFRALTLVRNAVSTIVAQWASDIASDSLRAQIRQLKADMQSFRALKRVRNAVSTIVAQRANNRRLEPKQIAFDNANSSIQQLEASSNHA